MNWNDVFGDKLTQDMKEATEARLGFALELYYPEIRMTVRIETQSPKIWERLGQWGPELCRKVAWQIISRVPESSTTRITIPNERALCVTRLLQGVNVLQIN